ncbi:MAG: sulfotransferase family protein [Caulobacteraceae bacterium]
MVAPAPRACSLVGGAAQLDAAARGLAPLGAPVIVYCASHSGSRLLADLLGRLGLFMGARLNDSGDALDVLDLVRYLIERHAPDFSPLFARADPQLAALVQRAFRAHLAGRAPGQPWGWKLPETSHVLPVVSRLFPAARCIHLVRDGRDVALSPFLAPKHPFWRRVYFNTDSIRRWRGLGLTQRAYRRHGPLFNAQRWVNSVTLGRAHGLMLGERYMEVRYEALVADPVTELARIALFIGVQPRGGLIEPGEIGAARVGKWRARPAREIRVLKGVLEPTLSAFGYGLSPRAVASEEGVSAGSGAAPGGLGGLFRVRARR